VTGFAEAGGDAGPLPALYGHPRGDRALMRAYFRKAGFKGGRYRGKARLLVVGADVPPGSRTASEAARQLRGMGFHVRLKRVPQDAVYTDYCQRPRRRVAMWREHRLVQGLQRSAVPAAAALRRSPHLPQRQQQPRPVERSCDQPCDESRRVLSTGQPRTDAWAAIDKQIMADAPAVPYVWDVATYVESADVIGVLNPYTTVWDYSFSALR